MKKLILSCTIAAAVLLSAQSAQAQSVVDGQTAAELAQKAKIAKAADKAKANVVKAEKKVQSAKKAIEKANKKYENAQKDLEKARKKAEEAEAELLRIQTVPGGAN